MTEDSRTRAGRDLSAIVRMTDQLLTQAVHAANDPTIPGGNAMVALAHVANQEAWEHQRTAGIDVGADLEDWVPPLQTLCKWSERWREAHAAEYDIRPTIASEAAFIRWALDWAHDNEPAWDQFVEDMRSVVARLEALLTDGNRTVRGVPCLSCEDAPDLIRPTEKRTEPNECDGHDGICYLPHQTCPHDRGGLRDEWVCPNCERRYDTDDYTRAVAHMHFAHAEWLTLEGAIERTGATRGSIQGWASKGDIARRKDLETGRVLYRIDDIEAKMTGRVA